MKTITTAFVLMASVAMMSCANTASKPAQADSTNVEATPACCDTTACCGDTTACCEKAAEEAAPKN